MLRAFSTLPQKMAPIERITLFKIPNEADRDRVLEQYKVLAKTAVKVFPPFPSLPFPFPLYIFPPHVIHTSIQQTPNGLYYIIHEPHTIHIHTLI